MTGLITSALDGFLTFGLGSRGRALTLPEAIREAILADAKLAELVGRRVHPGHLPAKGLAYPAVCFEVVNRTRGRNLKGSDGTADARVEFACYASTYLECRAVVEALFLLFDGMNRVNLSGCYILAALADDDLDEFDEGADGTDAGSYSDTLVINFRHRIARPER